MTVSVTLTCKKCGEKFTVSKRCYKQREAESYERWAKSACDMCPHCYAEMKRAERAAAKAKEDAEIKANCERVMSMSKSEIFKLSHQLTKKLLKGTVGLSYRATFGACLKEAYRRIAEFKKYYAENFAA